MRVISFAGMEGMTGLTDLECTRPGEEDARRRRINGEVGSIGESARGSLSRELVRRKCDANVAN